MAELQALFDQYPILRTAIGVTLVILLAYLADRLVKRILVATVTRLVRKTALQFDDLLVEENVFGRLAHFAPALAIYFGMQFVPFPSYLDNVVFNIFNISRDDDGNILGLGGRIQLYAVAVMILIGVSALNAALTALGRGYAKTSHASGRPIEAYAQVTKIVIYVVGGIFFVATFLERDPWGMLTGLGALMAVLLLVFRDTILSFVASLQMASYDMIRVGDWIEMSQYGADGDVIELSLHTVKVQNWDKTITAIPTHKLIEQPFRNWRGMQESGGRRIKRSVFVDMNSIRFLSDEDLDRLQNVALLRDYIVEKRAELADFNKEFAADGRLDANSRRLTNVGTYRAYLTIYLQRHPSIHQGMTLIVRQLAPTPEGLPIELYVFTRTTAWSEYEDIQSDIFDHVFSIAPEFGIRVFQTPSGTDFASLRTAIDR